MHSEKKHEKLSQRFSQNKWTIFKGTETNGSQASGNDRQEDPPA